MPDLPVDPQLILNHIHDGLLLVDTEGRILWTNQAFREMIGRPDEELAGRKCCELGIGDFCKEHCPLNELGDSSCRVNAHFNVNVDSKEGGQPGAYCFVTSPVTDKSGKRIGFMENFRGMDRVRDVILQLEEVNSAINDERKKTDDLIDSLADGVFSVDQDLRIRRFSQNMETMLGIPAEEALGRPCREVLGGTLCDTDCPLVWSREHDSPVTGCREELTTRDGRSIPVQITTGFLKNEPDFERGLFGVVSDRSEVEGLRRELEERTSFHGIIGSAPIMLALFHQIEAVSPTDATVLVLGESGTGKELVARAIHDESPRGKGPFVGVNCAALVHELLESELFGHVRGAFTGALRDRRGRFEQANDGTLFLDEIGDLSQALQAKLLRAIQEKAIEPVGSGTTRQVNVRIIAATNKDLVEEIRAGRFREDLYYRLNVIPINVPPLRERKGDIPLLVSHFMRKYRQAYRERSEGELEGVSERALSLLETYTWPGNVRELEHAVEYALISSDNGRIERAFLPATVRGLPADSEAPRPATPTSSGDSQPASESTSESESDSEARQVLVQTLEKNHWNIGRTAVDLGLSRTTLWRRMKREGIDRTAT